MEVAKIQHGLSKFIRKHRRKFNNLVLRETALLELGTLVIATEHYRLAGYKIRILNSSNGIFRVKLTSRGSPYNFSWFKCSKNGSAVEIHANLSVEGSHGDGGVYVVDVAVVQPNKVPRKAPKKKPKKRWRLKNRNLITFIEAKKLVVYPMLVAQFIGIVHEILPRFLNSASTRPTDHFSPSLVTVGYLKGTAEKIVQAFPSRKFDIKLVPSFDSHLSNLRQGRAAASPFLVQTFN